MFNKKVEKFIKTLDEEVQEKLERWVLNGLENESFLMEDVEDWSEDVIKSFLEEI